ncbi:putative nuclease HARBI1 [Linepithema humile]|uniref:putative nuclease HARBI1 n=1 Tax=Linepithema humile TaxID=83485 RepID=UPI00351DC0B1
MEEEDLLLIILLMQTWYTFNLMIYYALRSRQGQGRRWWRRPVSNSFFQIGDFSQLFQELKNTDHEEFYHYTRMTPDQFDWLLEKTKPYLLKRSRRRSFPSELRLAVTLGYLAHADSVWSKKWSFRIGRSTVYKIIPETCNAIIKALQPIYLPPMTRKDWRNVADGFYEKWNFPNCIGALDGKHVRIQAPKNSGSLFFNYKKFFSIVLMAICDADYIFKWVDIGDYGSISDGGVWLNSDFGSSLEQGLIDLPHPEPLLGTNTPFPFAFVGDEAFPLKTYLMRSYAKPKRLRHQQQAPAAQAQTIFEANSNYNDKDIQNENILNDNGRINEYLDHALPGLAMPQRIFNYRLSRARRVIENAFGILVSKWAILKNSICCKPETAESIVMALICLHNFLII